MTSSALRHVATTAKRRADADAAFRAAIRSAREMGASFRTIAAAAGLSAEHVRRICKEGSR